MLLDVVRDRLGLTGAKRSCDVQVCGACTLLIDGISVSSCCTLAYEANGKRSRRSKGSRLRATCTQSSRRSSRRAGSSAASAQAGCCSPTKALLADIPHPTPEHIKHELAGNLCRCTGYWNIIEAVEEAARLLSEEEGGGA